MTDADKAREAKIRLARKKLQQFQRKKQTESVSGSQEDVGFQPMEIHQEPSHHLQSMDTLGSLASMTSSADVTLDQGVPLGHVDSNVPGHPEPVQPMQDTGNDPTAVLGSKPLKKERSLVQGFLHAFHTMVAETGPSATTDRQDTLGSLQTLASDVANEEPSFIQPAVIPVFSPPTQPPVPMFNPSTAQLPFSHLPPASSLFGSPQKSDPFAVSTFQQNGPQNGPFTAPPPTGRVSPMKQGEIAARPPLPPSLFANSVGSSDPFGLRTSPTRQPQDPFAVRTSPIMQQQDPFAVKTSPIMQQQDPFAVKTSPIMQQQIPFLGNKSPTIQQPDPFAVSQTMHQHDPFAVKTSPTIQQQTPFLGNKSPTMQQDTYPINASPKNHYDPYPVKTSPIHPPSNSNGYVMHSSTSPHPSYGKDAQTSPECGIVRDSQTSPHAFYGRDAQTSPLPKYAQDAHTSPTSNYPMKPATWVQQTQTSPSRRENIRDMQTSPHATPNIFEHAQTSPVYPLQSHAATSASVDARHSATSPIAFDSNERTMADSEYNSVEALNLEINQLQDQWMQSQYEKKSLLETITTQSERLETVIQERIQAEELLASFMTRYSQSNADIETMREKMKMLEAKEATLDRREAILNSKERALEFQPSNPDLMMQIEELQQKLAYLDQETSEKMREFEAALEKEQVNFKAEKEAFDKAKKQFELDKQAQVQSMMNEYKDRMDKLAQEFQWIEKERNQVEQMRASLETSPLVPPGKIEKLELELNHLKQENVSLNHRLMEMQKESDRVKELEKNNKELQTELVRLTDALHTEKQQHIKARASSALSHHDTEKSRPYELPYTSPQLLSQVPASPQWSVASAKSRSSLLDTRLLSHLSSQPIHHRLSNRESHLPHLMNGIEPKQNIDKEGIRAYFNEEDLAEFSETTRRILFGDDTI